MRAAIQRAGETEKERLRGEGKMSNGKKEKVANVLR